MSRIPQYCHSDNNTGCNKQETIHSSCSNSKLKLYNRLYVRWQRNCSWLDFEIDLSLSLSFFSVSSSHPFPLSLSRFSPSLSISIYLRDDGSTSFSRLVLLAKELVRSLYIFHFLSLIKGVLFLLTSFFSFFFFKNLHFNFFL